MFDFLQIFGYYSLLLAVFGIVGNLLIIYVCVKAKRNSLFVLIKYKAFNDIVCLFDWNISHFSETILNCDLQNSSLMQCKLGSWLQFSSLQTSAWILVNMCDAKIKEIIKQTFTNLKVFLSLDQYFSFKITKWRKIYFRKKTAEKLGLISTILFYFINSNVIITFGYEKNLNGTINIECFYNSQNERLWMQIWGNVCS